MTDPIVPLDPKLLKNENYEISGVSVAKKYYLPRPIPRLDSNNADFVFLRPGQDPYPGFTSECGGWTYSLLTDVSKVGSLVVSSGSGFPVLQIASQKTSDSGQTKTEGFKKKYLITLRAQLTAFPELGNLDYDLTKNLAQPELFFTMQDRCLGVYFHAATVTFKQHKIDDTYTDVSFPTSDLMKKVLYNLKDPASVFTVERVVPYLFCAEG